MENYSDNVENLSLKYYLKRIKRDHYIQNLFVFSNIILISFIRLSEH